LLSVCLIGTGPQAVGFETWVARRDAGVVRQARDYSCGLASLATLFALRGWPGASEEALLSELLTAGDGGAQARITRRGVSFADLAMLASNRGLRALGVQASVTSLARLRQPALVALRVPGGTHFAVVRAVADDGAVLIADPSWGNRWLSAWEFAQRFEEVNGSGRGRLLLVGRHDDSAATAAASPLRAPRRRAHLPPALSRAAWNDGMRVLPE
jgi:predicted double-glycine peptidase